jgi:hypothetical protein
VTRGGHQNNGEARIPTTRAPGKLTLGMLGKQERPLGPGRPSVCRFAFDNCPVASPSFVNAPRETNELFTKRSVQTRHLTVQTTKDGGRIINKKRIKKYKTPTTRRSPPAESKPSRRTSEQTSGPPTRRGSARAKKKTRDAKRASLFLPLSRKKKKNETASNGAAWQPCERPQEQQAENS